MKLFSKKKNRTDDRLNLANHAFDRLLKPGEHYTVAAEAQGFMLVKKEIKWAYFSKDGNSYNALFTIKTDKGTFAFQVNGDKINLIPADLVMSMYTFK